MKATLLAICFVALASVLRAQSVDSGSASGAIAGVLDGSHAAAAAADEDRYFSYFAPDAVFLGTDATERWTRDEFRQWAHPHFARGKAWSFKSISRSITLSPDQRVAWFDEALATSNLGPCRGSGVLVATDAGWKITQYNLSIPIPNELADEFKTRIEVYAKQKSRTKGM